MQVPVAIAGENRSVTLGQIIDALAAAIVPFSHIDETAYTFEQASTGAGPLNLPVVFRNGKFYAVAIKKTTVSGKIIMQAVFYTDFTGKANFYDDEGNVRTDCLFIDREGRLYRYSGGTLVSAGITEEQAQQIKLLTPQPVESETALQAMEAAGLIVPGQLYYIPEND